jgi:hypothetical protein
VPKHPSQEGLSPGDAQGLAEEGSFRHGSQRGLRDKDKVQKGQTKKGLLKKERKKTLFGGILKL